MGSRKSKTHSVSDTTSSADYADWTKGSGQNALGDLNSIYQRDKNKSPDEKIYQGDRVIKDFNPETNAAIDAVGQNAKAAGHTATDIHDMTQGGVNPYFEQNLQDNLDKLGARLSNSAAYGGYGTADTGRVIGREMGSAMTGAMNDQYNATQQRRLQANALEQNAYQGINTLQNSRMNAAGKRDVLGQAQLDSQREKWGETQNYDWQNLGKYIEGLNAIRSGTGKGVTHAEGTSTTKSSGSPLDVAQGIAGIGSTLFGGGSIGAKALNGSLFGGGLFPPAPKSGGGLY